MLLNLAVKENHSLVIPLDVEVFPVVASLCHTGNTSAFAGYQLLFVKKSLPC